MDTTTQTTETAEQIAATYYARRDELNTDATLSDADYYAAREANREWARANGLRIGICG